MINKHYSFASFFDDNDIKPFAFLLSKKLMDGHICINLKEKYSEELAEYIKIAEQKEDFELAWEKLENNKLITKVNDNSINITTPFVLTEKSLYITRYYKYETNVIERIKAIIHSGKEKLNERLNKEISQNDSKNSTNDLQSLALVNSYLNNFSIITGGPGTGKTTTIAKLINLLFNENNNLKVGFAAPTGKAKQRMFESLMNNEEITKNSLLKNIVEKAKPKTIHSFLGYIHNSVSFKYNADNKLPHDVIIIDEASMIDISMFSKLLDAVRDDARIIFLGDKNQLASVDAGSIFSDLCNSVENTSLFSEGYCELLKEKLGIELKSTSKNELLIDSIVELQTSHRFPDNSMIGRLSKGIIEGDKDLINKIIEESKNKENAQIKFLTDDKDLDAGLVEFKEYFKPAINAKEDTDALNELNNAKILCAIKESENGVVKINSKIEKLLQINTNKVFYENRPILVTKNYDDLDIFNGDIGIIRNSVVILPGIDNTIIKIEPALINEMETVYAMTIHKSQGSEYKNVMVVLPKKKDNRLLTRELLYTAVTRTAVSTKEDRTALYIVATKDVLEACIEKNVNRASGLINRINK